LSANKLFSTPVLFYREIFQSLIEQSPNVIYETETKIKIVMLTGRHTFCAADFSVTLVANLTFGSGSDGCFYCYEKFFNHCIKIDSDRFLFVIK